MKTATKLLAILGIAGLAGLSNTTCQAADAVQTKINPKDGAEMVFVPAGPFKMGMDPIPMDQEQRPQYNTPKHEVTLDGYWIYKYPVTVKQYKKYLEANKDRKPYQHFTGKMPEEPLWGWQDDHPMVMVDWDDAKDYAQWAGAALPTEAQWEKAARGTDERLYPWGNNWDPTACVHSDKVFCDAKGTRPVGSCPKNVSPYGAMDMAGNVWEFCDDYFREDWYIRAEPNNPKGPPAFLTVKSEKNPQGVRHNASGVVTRGGSWALCAPKVFQTVNRDFPMGGMGDYPAMDTGFRCVVADANSPSGKPTSPALKEGAVVDELVKPSTPAPAPATVAQPVKPTPPAVSGAETEYIYTGDYYTGQIHKISTADGSYECFITRKEVLRGTSLGLEFDSHKNLYSTGGGKVVKIAPDKTVTEIVTGFGNSVPLTVDSNDNLYVGDYLVPGYLFRIDAKTLATEKLPIKLEYAKDASGKQDSSKYTITPEGAMKACPGERAEMSSSYGLNYDKNGNVYFTRLGYPFCKYDSTGSRIKMSKTGKAQTYWQRGAIMDMNGDFYAFGMDIAKTTPDGRVIARMTVGLDWHHSVAIVMDTKGNIYQGNQSINPDKTVMDGLLYKYTPDGQRSVWCDHCGRAPFYLAIWPRVKFPADKPTK